MQSSSTLLPPQRAVSSRLTVVLATVMVAICTFAALAPHANAETRSLKLYYLHTKEKATITYKRDGRFLKSGLDKINWFLRDWRRDEPTKMDPQLLDLLWEVYKQSGSSDYIHVISAYRSPATNNMLRRRGRGVARNSQHTLGKAMDFFLPDVKLSKLRNIGLRKQVGGVGFYPGSGSPFVHLDTGRVRHWPRMSRQQLARVFPKGQTLHVPSDGKPLPGYEIAKARYDSRKASAGKIQIASGAEEKKTGGGILGRLFARNDAKDTEPGDQNTGQQVASATPTARSGPAPQAEIASQPSQTPQAGQAPVQSLAAVENAPPVTVPIPTLAPRGQETGTLLAIADQAEPQEQFATLAPAEQALPVLAPNPQLQAQVSPQGNLQAGQTAQQIVAGLQGERLEMEAWTADEIADLRRSAVPVRTPRPSMAVGVTPPTTLALAQPAQNQRPTARQALTAAVVEPSVQGQSLATPQPRPVQAGSTQAGPTQAGPSQATLELALAANRKSSRATQAIRDLIEATEAAGRLAEERTEEAPLTALALSGIPVPQPNPLRAASRQPAVALASVNTDRSPGSVGKWALRGDRGMRRAMELRPPAYGVNAVSTAADAVASDGFVKSAPDYNPERLFLSSIAIDRFTTATIIRN